MKHTQCVGSILLGLTALVAGCQSSHPPPDFTASGYLADRGAVRIWRKDYQNNIKTTHIRTIFTSFDQVTAEVTDYHWEEGKLTAMERHVKGTSSLVITLRFDPQEKLAFMQRERNNRREALNENDIALYQFQSQRVLKTSDDLLRGGVVLHQGYRTDGGRIKTCQQTWVYPGFDAQIWREINRHQEQTTGLLSIAWLKAREGTQLLWISDKDLCQQVPDATQF